MRVACLLLAVAALNSAGCSMLLLHSGHDVEDFTTRADVQATFGQPLVTGEADGRTFEEYLTRRIFADPYRASPGHAMGYFMSLGLYELVLFPHTLYHVGKRTVLGQHLRFEYDVAGNVIQVSIDVRGERWYSRPYRPPEADR